MVIDCRVFSFYHTVFIVLLMVLLILYYLDDNFVDDIIETSLSFSLLQSVFLTVELLILMKPN